MALLLTTNDGSQAVRILNFTLLFYIMCAIGRIIKISSYYGNVKGSYGNDNLGLRFFLCPLMVDSLHLPLFPLY